jgi:hypothetical protein
MNLAQPDWAKNGWTCRYEDLRRGAVEGYAPARNSWGLTLFLRQGLVAWMHAWPRKHVIKENPTGHHLGGSTIGPLELAPSLRTQITLVLADMIFHRPQEVMT